MSKHTQVSLLQLTNSMKLSTSKKLKFLARGIFYQKELIKIHQLFNTPNLKPILKNQINFYTKFFRSYLFCNIKMIEKFNNIHSHYNYISKYLNDKAIEDIYTTHISLIECNIEEIGKINVKLCNILNLGKEGEMTLLLELNDEELYSVQFSFLEKDGKSNFIIYGIQGRNTVDPELLKLITKKMHGVRPRNFIFFIIRQICENLHISQIKALSSKYHVVNCTRMKNTLKFQADYDEYWEEEKGIQDGIFYILPLEEPRKSMEEIASKKRSMYKKRYVMLDAYKEEINKNFTKLLG